MLDVVWNVQDEWFVRPCQTLGGEAVSRWLLIAKSRLCGTFCTSGSGIVFPAILSSSLVRLGFCNIIFFASGKKKNSVVQTAETRRRRRRCYCYAVGDCL